MTPEKIKLALKTTVFPKGTRRGELVRYLNHTVRTLKKRLIGIPLPNRPSIKERQGGSYLSFRLPPDTAEAPAVDILIVTFNSSACIEGCFESIRRSRYPLEKIHIIIMDNGSDDNTVSIVSRYKSTCENLTIVAHGENIGFGCGMNRAFQHGNSPYVFVLNPDTEIDEECLARLVARAEQSEGHGFVAWEARQQPYEHPKAYDPVTLEGDWASGACFLMRRDAFGALDGFDRRIFLYCEDIDLSLRIRMNGWKIMYVPDAVVTHDTYEEPGKIKPTQFYHSLISHALLRYKYTGVKHFLFFHLLFLKRLFRPPALPNVRWRLVSLYLRNIPNFLGSFIWKLKHRRRISNIDLYFDVINVGVVRKGAFYTIQGSSQAPLVSIVIRTRGRPDFLRDALQSVRNQTYRNIEVIVAEDRADSARDVIDEFNDLDITHIPVGEPGGRCVAGNLAFSRAKGKYINLLDDDDLFYADHVEVLVDALENNGAYKAAYSIGFEVMTEVVRESPLTLREYSYSTLHEQSFDRELLSWKNFMPINCVMFDRSLFQKEGGFDDTVDVLEDWDLWIRYSKHTDFLYVPKTTCVFRTPYEMRSRRERKEVLADTYYEVFQRYSS
jgi:GT2 family glycosyltransferase